MAECLDSPAFIYVFYVICFPQNMFNVSQFDKSDIRSVNCIPWIKMYVSTWAAAHTCLHELQIAMITFHMQSAQGEMTVAILPTSCRL